MPHLTIVVDIADDDPAIGTGAQETAEDVLAGAQPYELVTAAWDLPDDPPELIRRAYDEARGRRGRRCVTSAHRARVAELRHLGAGALRDRLVSLHVRIDPPARERVCSCEGPGGWPGPPDIVAPPPRGLPG
jgi:hypothetical protein